MWADMAGVDDDIAMVRALIAHYDTNAAQVAARIGVANTTINRYKAGTATSRLSRATLAKLREAFPDFPAFVADADLPVTTPARDYVAVEVLPTYGGLGGGGNGDGDHETGLVPARLVVSELHGQPGDFLLIDTRGDSMAPDFHHGDQVLIDKRDVRPTQPGYFALWDGDGYVLKNVERVGDKLRIFSSNGKYSERLCETDDVRILGRPVWVARRL